MGAFCAHCGLQLWDLSKPHDCPGPPEMAKDAVLWAELEAAVARIQVVMRALQERRPA